MKVAIVLSNTPGYSETFFQNKIKGLISRGFQVELYVDKISVPFHHCPTFVLPETGWINAGMKFVSAFLLHPIRFLHFIVLEFRSDRKLPAVFRNIFLNLHLMNSKGINWVHFGFATTAVGREHIAKCLGAKMAVSLRGYDISRFPLRNPGIYEEVWKHVDKVHTISDALAVKAKQTGMPDSLTVVKITPAIDVSIFNSAVVKKDFNKPLQLTTIARLHWSKGLEYTLDALARLAKLEFDFNYVIIGDGKDLDRLVLAAHQYGIRDRVRFAGMMSHDQVKSRLTETDIYIQYSVQEGFCNAALEAQAMGLLCVLSDAEGLPENVKDSITGFVVPKRKPELLAKKIISIINTDPGHLQEMKNHAMHRVHENFNLQQQIEEFAKFYSQ